MTEFNEAVAAVDDAIEIRARRENPGVTLAKAVAQFLETPAGARMYALRESVVKLGRARPPEPAYAAVEAIAEGLIAKGRSAPEAYVEAFDRVSGR